MFVCRLVGGQLRLHHNDGDYVEQADSSALEWKLSVQTLRRMSGMRKSKGDTTHDVTFDT